MNFKVGQPVWQLGHCHERWRPATIVCYMQYARTICQGCGYLYEGPAYQVDPDDGVKPPYGAWVSPSSHLRPRDPDQFKAADPSFEWRDITVAA